MPELISGTVGNMSLETFYIKSIGFSHLSGNKPCQDDGLHYNDGEVEIVVTCDGHGSESFVRSEIGARIAAETTKDVVIKYIRSDKFSLLKGYRGAVTARPTENPLENSCGESIEFSQLSESQQEIVLQNISYIKSTKNSTNIEELFRQLFYDIAVEWRVKVIHDAKTNPFSPKEREKVRSSRVERAYGCTLLCVVRTPNYWFAFQIGDGKILSCDNLMNWSEPVPWDYKCFLNRTTSLCDSHPEDEFRYSYNGCGEFPLAIFCGSDGIDGTFITESLLQKCYSQILEVVDSHGFKNAISLLEKQLPIWSEKGSHDDMSMAGIIVMDRLSDAVKYNKLISEVKSLNKERAEREIEIAKHSENVEKLDILIESLKQNYDETARNAWARFISWLRERDQDLELIHQKKEALVSSINERLKTEEKVKILTEEFDLWKSRSKERVIELKSLADELKAQILGLPNESETEESNNAEDSTPKVVKVEPLSEEETRQMDRDSEAQVKEILNPDKK